MYLQKFTIFLVLLFSIQVSAGEYFVRLTPKGIQSKASLVKDFSLSKSAKDTVLSPKKIEFKYPIRHNRYADRFKSWIKAVTLSDGDEIVLDSLKRQGIIEQYEPVRALRILQSVNDSLFQEQWYLNTINAFDAWLITQGSEDVIIGVIDTGIDYNHPELEGSLWTNYEELNGISGIDDDENGFVDDSIGWDFTDAPRFADGGDYIDPDNDPMDEYGSGHGTQIAGIIAAKTQNGRGIAGIGSNLTVMNLRAGTSSGYLEEDDVANALIYALDNGARITNMSFGDVALSSFLKDVIYFAYQQGMVIIASAGNSGTDEIHYPSGLPETISVGATDQNDNITSFSNYGPTIDCVAPGNELISTAVDGKYNRVSGTSFSAPIVSAIAGLILSINPEYGPERVRNILKSSSEDIHYEGWDNYSGAGRVSALNAVSVPDGGILRLIQPVPNSSTAENEVKIVATALHPDIKNILLEYGEGKDPIIWNMIANHENRQILEDSMGVVNLTTIQDSVLTIRLVMTLYNGNKDELRTNLKIDRTSPVIDDIKTTLLYDGSDISQLISFVTDDITRAKIYISKDFTTSPIETRELGYETKSHRIKLNESEFTGDYQFYIEVENQSQLTSIDDNNGSFYAFSINNDFEWEEFVEVPWDLPPGYLLEKPVDLDNDDKLEIVLSRYDENQAFGPIEIYEFENGHFEKRLETGFRAIPRDAGDVDKDGLSDILLGYGKLSYLFESTSIDEFPENLVWSDTVDFWAAGYADLDNDGKNEIIGRDDSSYIILENFSDNDFNEIGVLLNPTSGTNQLSVPNFELFDINDDGVSEIVFGDYDGDLILYRSTGDNTFQALPSTQVSHFDATSLISGINFNSQSKLFVASHTSDDLDYEHEFDARYWSIDQFVPDQDQNDLENSGVVNIYGYQNLREFDSGIKIDSIYGRMYLFSALYPNFHIFRISQDEIIPVWNQKNAWSNAILVADFDNNLIEEFYYNDGAGIRGYTLPIQNRPHRPNQFTANPLDSISASLKWSDVANADYYRLYRGINKSDLEFYSQVMNTTYIDSGLANNRDYYYAVSVIDSSFEVIESMLSYVDSVRTSTPPKLISADIINEKQVIISFDKQIAFRDEFTFSAYCVLSEQFSTSAIILKDQASILVSFAHKFIENMTDTIVIKNVFDSFGMPVNKALNSIAVYYEEELSEPYIQGWEIVDRITININFSEPMRESDIEQSSNYKVYPRGGVITVEILDELNTSVQLTLSDNSKIGAVGFENYLLLENLHSLNGVLLKETEKINFNEEISDLSNVFIYPQPVKPHHDLITFAQLPDDVTIYIFNMNGKLIRTLQQETQFGGVQWNLKESNGRSVHSGIYIYRIIHTKKEKIGKLVIVR